MVTDPWNDKQLKLASGDADKDLCGVWARLAAVHTPLACSTQLGSACNCECQCWEGGEDSCRFFDTDQQSKCDRKQKKNCVERWRDLSRYVFDPQVLASDFGALGVKRVAAEAAMFRVPVSSLLFTQRRGSYRFSGKTRYSIANTLCLLVRGELNPNDLPPLQIAAYKVGTDQRPRIMSLSNRRLIALQVFAFSYPEKVKEYFGTDTLYVDVELAQGKSFENQLFNVDPQCHRCGSCMPGRRLSETVIFHMREEFQVDTVFHRKGASGFDKLMKGKKCEDVRTFLDDLGTAAKPGGRQAKQDEGPR